MFYTGQTKLTKIQKLHIFFAKVKNLSVADFLSQPSTKAETQLNQLKNEHLPPPL